MFRPARMIHVRALILERDQLKVLQDLGHLGLLQLTLTEAGPDTAPLSARDHRPDLLRCEQILRRIDSLRGALPVTPLAAASAWTLKRTLDQAESELNRMEAEAKELLSRRQELLQRSNELTRVSEQLASFGDIDLPFGQFERFSFIYLVAGTLPPTKLEDLQKLIGDKVALFPLPERDNRQPLIAITTRARRLQLETALQQVGFEQEKFSNVNGLTSDGFSQEKQHKQQNITEELRNADAQLLAFSTAALNALAEMDDFVQTEKRLLYALQNFARTDAAVLLTGWVPTSEAGELEKQLLATTQGRCVIEFAAPEDFSQEEVPVLLRHGRLLRPFQMLLAAFGLPTYEEIEPTVFVAISYLLMFGMMFGDVGHGAVLALIGVTALVVGRTSKLRDLGVIILFAGFSSIAFGLLSGSCFGLPQLKRYALWHNPLDGNPLSWIYAAILFGIIILNLGLILNVINHLRRGAVLRGLLDKFGVSGLVFYWGALALILKFTAIQSRGLLVPVIIVSLVMPLAGWIINEPIQYLLSTRRHVSGQPRVALAALLTNSVVSSFEAMLSYLANTISFVRLAAYAMSHAALVLAIFLVAAEVRHFAVIGGFMRILLIVVANLLAIGLEAIIASVQALRLEYYEFFSKFFSASGQPFKPFCLTSPQALPQR